MQPYYLETPEELEAAIAERKNRQGEIRAALNRWMEEDYGISDMSEVTRAFFQEIGIPTDEPVGVLARQIGTVNAEGVAFHLGCEALGMNGVTLNFGMDQFSVHSLDKRAAVDIPWISHSNRKGTRILERERIARGADNIIAIDQVMLNRIATKHGSMLTEFHHGLRKAFYRSDLPYLDISDLHVRYFRMARPDARPEFVYVTHESGRAERIPTNNVNGHVARPPAKWYYPLYFTWFLDGSMVLFETYENPAGQVAEAKLIFEQAMDLVKAKTGFYPLVARTPILSPDMLFCNRGLLEKPNALEDLRTRTAIVQARQPANIHDFFRGIADEVIGYR